MHKENLITVHLPDPSSWPYYVQHQDYCIGLLKGHGIELWKITGKLES